MLKYQSDGEKRKMIKILIADDQELIRQSLQIILNNEQDFEVTDAVEMGKGYRSYP